MRGSSLILSIFLLLPLLTVSQTIVWRDIPEVRTGQITMLTALTTSTDSAPSVNQTFVDSLPGLNATNASYPSHFYGLSLISYQSWMTDSFGFNITLASLTSTFIGVTFTVLDNTYFTSVKIHYIAGVPPSTPYYSLEVHYGCFLTANLLQSNGIRNQTVSNQTTVITNQNAVIRSMIGGLQLKNSVGNDNSVQVNTTLVGNELYHLIQIGNNNFLKFICLTTVMMDPTITTNTYTAIIEYKIMGINYASNLNQVVYVPRYDGSSRLFFGISAFNLSMADTRYLNVQTSNISLVSQLFATNSMLTSMTYETFFFAYRNCTGNLSYDPTIYDCTANCSSNQIFTPNQTLCMPCYYTCQTCSNSSYIVCLTCNSTLNRQAVNNDTCACVSGYVDIGVQQCDTCGAHISGCLTCSSTTNCTTCDTQYVVDNTTFLCDCRPGFYYASTYCLPYPGCLTAFYMTTGTYCSTCDTANNFTLAANYSCTCLQGMQLNTTTNGSCYHICGNGITPYGGCDDGNLNSGDGCSSSCTIEPGWHCTYNSTTDGISTCVKIYDLKLTYLYSQKIISSNQAQIVFSLTPPQYNLPTNIFKNSITTSLPATAASFTFDPITSTVTILSDYLTSIEGSNQTLTIDFSGLTIYAYPYTTTFTPIGLNAKLVIETLSSQNTIIMYLSMGLSLFSVLIAIFAAVVGLKLIGMELIIPVQLIYFSMATLQSLESYTSSLNQLKYSNGYNTLASYDYMRTYMQNTSLVNMNYESEYLLSCNIMIAIFILILLFLLIHHLRLKYKQEKLNEFLESAEYKKMAEQDSQDDKSSEESEEKETDEEEEKMKLKKEVKGKNRQLQQQEYKMRSDHHRSFKIFTFEVDRIYFIFFIILINQTMFSFIIMTLNVPISTFMYPEQINVMACNLFYFLFIGNLVFISYDQDSNKMIAFTCIKDQYAYLYIGLDFLIIIVLSMSFTEKFSSYLIAALSLLFVVLVLKEKPYNNIFFTLENVFALYNQIMLVACLIIICYLQAVQNASEITYMICSYIILGLIALAEILSIIRIALKVNFKKAFDDLKNHDLELDKNKKKKSKKVIEKKLDLLDEQNDKVQILPPDSVRNGLFTPKDRMIDWQSRNTEEYQTLKKQQQRREVAVDNHEQEQDALSDVKVDEKYNELELIKRRLRNNLNMKKEQLKKQSELFTKKTH